jgi:hypothetical protein
MAGAFSPDSVRIEPECKVRNDIELAGCFQWQLKLSLDGKGRWVREFALFPPQLKFCPRATPDLLPNLSLGVERERVFGFGVAPFRAGCKGA